MKKETGSMATVQGLDEVQAQPGTPRTLDHAELDVVGGGDQAVDWGG